MTTWLYNFLYDIKNTTYLLMTTWLYNFLYDIKNTTNLLHDNMAL